MSIILRKCVCSILVFIFSITSVVLPSNSYAQSVVSPALTLPAVGNTVNVSQAFTPVLIKGLTIDQSDPFKFEFLMDQGDVIVDHEDTQFLQNESMKLVKYFLACLTTPEEDLWVNLSPYEQDRIIPESLGVTEMGRDLLSQDYILKQLTASLMSPESESGKKMWERIYEKIYDAGAIHESSLHNDLTHHALRTTDLIESFNKVWIVPQIGYFYEHNNSVLITDARLKVMLESDYFAQQKNVSLRGEAEAIPTKINSDKIASQKTLAMTEATGAVSVSQRTVPLNDIQRTNDVKQIIRDIIIPIIEDEVNNGENFAPLRQVYNAMLMAVWFKKRIKHHLLSDVYVDQRKVAGIDSNDPSANEAIWKQYVETFQSGVGDVIREEYDPVTQSLIPKKYFVGGTTTLPASNAQLTKKVDFAALVKAPFLLGVRLPFESSMDSANKAMLTKNEIEGLILQFLQNQNENDQYVFRKALEDSPLPVVSKKTKENWETGVVVFNDAVLNIRIVMNSPFDPEEFLNFRSEGYYHINKLTGSSTVTILFKPDLFEIQLSLSEENAKSKVHNVSLFQISRENDLLEKFEQLKVHSPNALIDLLLESFQYVVKMSESPAFIGEPDNSKRRAYTKHNDPAAFVQSEKGVFRFSGLKRTQNILGYFEAYQKTNDRANYYMILFFKDPDSGQVRKRMLSLGEYFFAKEWMERAEPHIILEYFQTMISDMKTDVSKKLSKALKMRERSRNLATSLSKRMNEKKKLLIKKSLQATGEEKHDSFIGQAIKIIKERLQVVSKVTKSINVKIKRYEWEILKLEPYGILLQFLALEDKELLNSLKEQAAKEEGAEKGLEDEISAEDPNFLYMIYEVVFKGKDVANISRNFDELREKQFIDLEHAWGDDKVFVEERSDGVQVTHYSFQEWQKMTQEHQMALSLIDPPINAEAGRWRGFRHERIRGIRSSRFEAYTFQDEQKEIRTRIGFKVLVYFGESLKTWVTDFGDYKGNILHLVKGREPTGIPVLISRLIRKRINITQFLLKFESKKYRPNEVRISYLEKELEKLVRFSLLWIDFNRDIGDKTQNNLKLLDMNMAMLEDSQEILKHTGGVDFRPGQGDIRIQEDANGFIFPKYDPTLRMMPLQRLSPVMMELKFITIRDAALRLGMTFPQDEDTDKTYAPQKAKEQDLLTVL